MKPITNVVGFDDAPFPHDHRGDVRVVGAVCCRTRLDGVLSDAAPEGVDPAAALEAFWSPSGAPPPAKWAAAGVFTVLLTLYFALAGRERPAASSPRAGSQGIVGGPRP